MFKKSASLFAQAQRSIPGGVNSPVRAFQQVGGTPIFMEKANGAHLFDADGNRYIDYIGSWGPMILGHQHPSVVAALRQQIDRATSFGAPTELEIQMAELVCQMSPNVDLVRFCSSGTEACMSAARLARGYTGRAKILKFDGHYHGHADVFLKKAGSGVATLGIKTVGGIPTTTFDDTLVAAFNDTEGVELLVKKHATTARRGFFSKGTPARAKKSKSNILRTNNILTLCIFLTFISERPSFIFSINSYNWLSFLFNKSVAY